MCWLKNKFITKAVIWLAAEILFNFLGIDTLADYSEFVFENHSDKNAVLLISRHIGWRSRLMTFRHIHGLEIDERMQREKYIN